MDPDALAALTTVPAKLCGVEKQLGTIEAGKIANLNAERVSQERDQDNERSAAFTRAFFPARACAGTDVCAVLR